jgi:hypothetical protein
MPARKEQQSSFRQTTVLVRADILEKAREQGMDISDACNRALADVLGIDYRQQQTGDVPVPPPVIIAKDGGLPAPRTDTPKPRPTTRPPVINADDPAAAGVIARSRKQTDKKPVPELPVKRPDLRSRPAPQPAAPEPEIKSPQKSKKPPEKKMQKGDGLKKFIATRLVREDSDDAVVKKEELFQTFSRWCREQKISIPDAKAFAATLKTRFAFKEKTIEGSPCWVHVKVK